MLETRFVCQCGEDMNSAPALTILYTHIYMYRLACDTHDGHTIHKHFPS
jgi:hypothetical protein